MLLAFESALMREQLLVLLSNQNLGLAAVRTVG